MTKEQGGTDAGDEEGRSVRNIHDAIISLDLSSEEDCGDDDEYQEADGAKGGKKQSLGIHTFFFIIADVTITGRMPKASSTEESESPKRAPRRRVATPRAPRKTVARTKAVPDTPVEEAPVVVRRKAPTKLPLSPASPVALYEASRAKKSLFVSGSLLILGLAIAAGVGYSDKGVINTAAIVAERNAQLAAGVTSTADGGTTMTIPVQNSASGLVDGGLVSSGEVPPLVPAATEVTTTTASSTESASSTEPVADDEQVSSDTSVTPTEEAASAEADAATPTE